GIYIRGEIETKLSRRCAMSGAAAQSGFVYQQDYAAFRILGSEAKRILAPNDSDHLITFFEIEGRQAPNGEVWDVALTHQNGVVELRECKDTAITAEDRTTFYKRVRRVANGRDPAKLQIGWVTDPAKQDGNILRHLEEMVHCSKSPTASA